MSGLEYAVGDRAALSWRRTALGLRRRGLAPDVVLTGAFLVLTAGVLSGTLTLRDWFPPSMLLIVELLGAFLLRLRGMVVLCAAVLGSLAALVLGDVADFTPGVLAVQVVAAVAVLAFVRNRERRGLQGASSDIMLVDLRDRLEAQGRIPHVPAGWRVETALRAAYAEAFSGDFVVAHRDVPHDCLEVALVDVSGKGQEAGVRSLLLSGAFGGLLGAMPREQFLPAANAYLLAQHWPEGFATAVHLTLALDSGEFWVSTAGHPPALHLRAGSGAVDVLAEAPSPALGILAGATYITRHGRLDRGDVLMLYTDGLVESPAIAIDQGIDRLRGVLANVVGTGRGGADAVLAGVRAGAEDDRAIVLVARD